MKSLASLLVILSLVFANIRTIYPSKFGDWSNSIFFKIGMIQNWGMFTYNHPQPYAFINVIIVYTDGEYRTVALRGQTSYIPTLIDRMYERWSELLDKHNKIFIGLTRQLCYTSMANASNNYPQLLKVTTERFFFDDRRIIKRKQDQFNIECIRNETTP